VAPVRRDRPHTLADRIDGCFGGHPARSTEWHTCDEVSAELGDVLGSAEERAQRLEQLRRGWCCGGWSSSALTSQRPKPSLSGAGSWHNG